GTFGRSGALFLALDPGLFRPAAEAMATAAAFAEEIRGLPPAPGFERVMAPGDPEARSRVVREGTIPLPAVTWRHIVDAAESLHVPVQSGAGRWAQGRRRGPTSRSIPAGLCSSAPSGHGRCRHTSSSAALRARARSWALWPTWPVSAVSRATPGWRLQPGRPS